MKEEQEKDARWAEVKGQMDQFKDANFEELREGFIDFSKQILDMQRHLLDVTHQPYAELEEKVLTTIKTMNGGINKDFAMVEKNFKHVNGELDRSYDTMSRIAAAAVVSLMRSVCVTEYLYKEKILNRRITEDEMLKLLPRKAKTFIAKTMGKKVKELEKLVEDYKS